VPQAQVTLTPLRFVMRKKRHRRARTHAVGTRTQHPACTLPVPEGERVKDIGTMRQPVPLPPAPACASTAGTGEPKPPCLSASGSAPSSPVSAVQYGGLTSVLYFYKNFHWILIAV
jgi:hypothetical protein